MKILIVLAALVMVAIMLAAARLIVREGMATRFYFSTPLWHWPIVLAVVFFVVMPVIDWLTGREIMWIARFVGVFAVSAVYVTLYTFGFLIGLRRRRRREGIIGFPGS